MILERKHFESVIEDVKNEICCSIPLGTKTDPITEIASDAFLDWKKLQYVYIPNNISIVHEHAFCWEKIKIVCADIQHTTIINMPTTVKVLPITGNESTLFSLLEEVMELKKQLEFNPEEIVKTDKKLNNLLQQFLNKSKEQENRICNQQQQTEIMLNQLENYSNQTETMAQEVLSQLQHLIDQNLAENIKEQEDRICSQQQQTEIMLQQLENYSNQTETIAEEVLSQLQHLIDQNLTENISVKKEEVEKELKKIKTEIKKLEKLLEKCSNVKENLENFQNTMQSELEAQRNQIQQEIEECLKDLSKEYEETKQEIIEKMVKETTEQLVKKNPCKTIIVNIEDAKKKFETKDIFHKDFEKVLKLVSTKKPILLKGPAGSGKNVIIEQVAKALDLQFYYCNDVTDEYKIMGFVDANGRFIETQFFQAFTKGGIIFIDEIDSSNASSLLAINASIGTGYNHYMAFPDGNFYQANENFHLVAAANTFGTGADMIYCGRQALDGATLNRFIPVTIDYDRDLERNIITHQEILNLYWQIRDIIHANTIRHVISTRNIKNASDLLDMNCFELGDIFDWTIIQGLEKQDLNIICSRITQNDDYSQQFLSHAQKKYKIDQRM